MEQRVHGRGNPGRSPACPKHPKTPLGHRRGTLPNRGVRPRHGGSALPQTRFVRGAGMENSPGNHGSPSRHLWGSAGSPPAPLPQHGHPARPRGTPAPRPRHSPPPSLQTHAGTSCRTWRAGAGPEGRGARRRSAVRRRGRAP